MIIDGFLMSRVCYILSFCPRLRFSSYLRVPHSFFFDSSILQTVSDAEEKKAFRHIIMYQNDIYPYKKYGRAA